MMADASETLLLLIWQAPGRQTPRTNARLRSQDSQPLAHPRSVRAFTIKRMLALL
jgi:hypothetical protein